MVLNMIIGFDKVRYYKEMHRHVLVTLLNPNQLIINNDALFGVTLSSTLWLFTLLLVNLRKEIVTYE